MTKRGVRKYVDDLLGGRRPRPFRADDFEAAELRTAIELRAAGDGAGEPRPEFVDSLESRIAEQLSSRPLDDRKSKAPSATRRQVIVGTTAAATAAVVAVSVDRLVSGGPSESPADAGGELVPTDGSWQAVAQSAEVPDGDMRPFDLGAVTGFVRRVDNRVEAVSGVCTHQGCKLWFNRSDDRLHCPCHATSFSPAGEVVTHQLPIAPKPLPHFEVRERDGLIEVLAPQPSTEPA